MNDLTPEYEPNFQIAEMKSAMMNMVYDAIMVDIDGAIKSSTPVPRKIEALTTILKYFENLEEYEKCANIKKIIQEIQDANNYSRKG